MNKATADAKTELINSETNNKFHYKAPLSRLTQTHIQSKIKNINHKNSRLIRPLSDPTTKIISRTLQTSMMKAPNNNNSKNPHLKLSGKLKMSHFNLQQIPNNQKFYQIQGKNQSNRRFSIATPSS